MNPIARLEELRAARRRFLTLTPPDSPNCPNCLDEGRRENRENRENRVGDNPEPATPPRDNRDSWDNRAGVSPESVVPSQTEPTGRELGQLGESGGVTSESDLAAEQRWGLPPAAEITPLTYFMPGLHRRDVDLLTAHLKRQPPEVWQWVEGQAERYALTARHWPRPVCHVAAMLDCLLWQWEWVLNRKAGRFDQITEAARKLRDLEEAAQDAVRFFNKRPPAPPNENQKGPEA